VVRLEWKKDALVALSGDFVIGGGPKVSVDLLHPPGEWVVHWKPESLDLSFEGLLSEETENRIFVTDSPTGNWLKGNFRASLRFDQPMRSTAQGSLQGKNIRFLQRLAVPVFIENFSMSSEGSRVAETVTFSWKEMRQPPRTDSHSTWMRRRWDSTGRVCRKPSEPPKRKKGPRVWKAGPENAGGTCRSMER
jgi:hypothetical protein